MKSSNKVHNLIFTLILFLIIVIVTLNLFNVLPFGNNGTSVAIILSIIAIFINLYSSHIRIDKSSSKEEIGKENIEKLCDDAANENFYPPFRDVFKRGKDKLEQFRKNLKHALTREFRYNFDAQSIKIEISKRYIKLFKKLVGKKYPQSPELNDFIKFLITKNLGYDNLANEILKTYVDIPESSNVFMLLLKAYYKDGYLNNFDELIERADQIRLEIRETEESPDNIILDKTSKENMDKLETSLVKMLKKNISLPAIIKTLESSNVMNQLYLIILGIEDESQKKLISESMQEEPLIKTKYERVFFIKSEYDHESIDSFLKEEFLENVPLGQHYAILATRVIPTQVSFIRSGRPDTHYKKLNESADKIRIEQKDLKGLISSMGIPIIEIVENATIDFFVQEDITTLMAEQIALIDNSENIYRSIREISEVEGFGVTAILKKIDKHRLSMLLNEHCELGEFRSIQIAESVKKSVSNWRKSIYLEGGD